MRSVVSVFVAQYFNIFLSEMVLIKLDYQFIQIIIREVRVSEPADCYSNAVFGTRVSVQEDKASPGNQNRK